MSLLFRFLCGIARNMPLRHYKLNRCNSIVCKHSRAVHVLRRIYSSETLIIRQADFIFGQACILGSRKRLSMEENAQKFQRPIAQTTLDQEEVNKFSLLAELWWDEAGEFEALHSMNELRVPLIRDALINKQSTSYNSTQPLKGLRILDVGSGGGILSEPLARLGAFVIGLDASEENIRIAQAHLIHNHRLANSIKYIQATVEDLLVTEGGTFDAVVASEVIEHVADAPTFVSACCQLVKPGGSIFFTTLNKTYLSYGLGIVAAENLLKLVPPGTHDWNKFIPPEELQYMLDKNNFTTHLIHGMMYNPLTKRWSWIQNTSVNYAIHALRATDSRTDSYQEKTFDSYSDTKKT